VARRCVRSVAWRDLKYIHVRPTEASRGCHNSLLRSDELLAIHVFLHILHRSKALVIGWMQRGTGIPRQPNSDVFFHTSLDLGLADVSCMFAECSPILTRKYLSVPHALKHEQGHIVLRTSDRSESAGDHFCVRKRQYVPAI
jgi:hypothetical protein